jgi:hypothetical protein
LTDKHLHIVCLDVPYPVDYGGVFDLFYKLQSLYEAGINIHLHCFEYGRGTQKELDKYCASVNYYERRKFLDSFSFRLPFIVSSRQNKDLLDNLLKDDYPILLEGIHCTYYLYTGQLKHKKVFVRLHNVEYRYYEELSKTTYNIFENIYFRLESFLLKKYEDDIANLATFITVSEKDKLLYQKKFDAKKIEFLPVFLPFSQVVSETGSGNFCLYHGNLSVPENEKAALWLIKNVFNTIDIPFVIAGKNPSKCLQNMAHSNDNICIVCNPSAHEMDDLIKKAQLHLLPAFNRTGIKIKLLNALFNGRFVIINTQALEDTGLGPLCETANTIEEYIEMTKQLFYKSFTEPDILQRKKILERLYNNHANTQKLIQWIW